MTAPTWQWSAGAIAQAVAHSEVSALEIVEATLRRIDAVEPTVNAFTERLHETALDEARAVDARIWAGRPAGRFAGVPLSIKANYDAAGSVTSEGCAPLAQAIAASDAPAVARMRAEGAIAVGRTNMPDLGLRMHTESGVSGATINPRDPTRTPGGSSGGEAAALATGMSAIGLGNDIGGSLRAPAHCCGVSSIKPTPGRVPHVRTTPPLDGPLSFQLMAVNGPMGRHVEDVRVALQVLVGAHPGDPSAIPGPLSESDGGTRVALVSRPPGRATDDDVADVVEGAGRALEDAGYEVEAVCPPSYVSVCDIWGRWLLHDLRAARPLLDPLISVNARRFLDYASERYAPLAAGELSDLLVRRRTHAREWGEWMAERPLIVMPVWTARAFRLGLDVESPAGAHEVLDLARPAMPANVLGLPAAVVPVAGSEALPIGVQIVGRPFDELRCLQAAAAIEARLPRPGLAGAPPRHADLC